MLLRLRNVPRLRALRLEEALFRADGRSWVIMCEWDSGGDAAAKAAAHEAAQCVVLGISGKPAEMVDAERAAAVEMPLIRRFSGGGTVVADADTLFVTFIAAGGAVPGTAPYPEPILQWSEGVYADALRSCGVDGFRVNANDYCIGKHKFGGNAQSISGKRWLHHTSLLWDYDPARMAVLQMPARRPAYRADRPHGEFLRGLAEAVGSRSELMEAILGAASQRFELCPVSLPEVEEVLSRPHRKVTKLVHGEGGAWAEASRAHRLVPQSGEFGC